MSPHEPAFFSLQLENPKAYFLCPDSDSGWGNGEVDASSGAKKLTREKAKANSIWHSSRETQRLSA